MPRLITVSGNQIDLLPASSYVLGRDKTCDIVIEDCSCSRQHARVSVDATGKRVYLEDLGSRNGTYLDDERIVDVRDVRENGRVRIGSTIFTVASEDIEQLDETCVMYSDTMLIDRVPSSTPLRSDDRAAIAGDLGSMGLLDVLQVLHQMAQTGQLHLTLADEHGRVDVSGGEVFDAELAGKTGLAALELLVHQGHGRFHFVEGPVELSRQIEMRSRELLLHLCRVLDESTKIEDQTL